MFLLPIERKLNKGENNVVIFGNGIYNMGDRMLLHGIDISCDKKILARLYSLGFRQELPGEDAHNQIAHSVIAGKKVSRFAIAAFNPDINPEELTLLKTRIIHKEGVLTTLKDNIIFEAQTYFLVQITASEIADITINISWDFFDRARL